MTTFVLSFIIFALAGLGLAIGLRGKKRNVRPGCCQMDPAQSTQSTCCRSARQAPESRRT